jgi:hypothetical protein
MIIFRNIASRDRILENQKKIQVRYSQKSQGMAAQGKGGFCDLPVGPWAMAIVDEAVRIQVSIFARFIAPKISQSMLFVPIDARVRFAQRLRSMCRAFGQTKSRTVHHLYPCLQSANYDCYRRCTLSHTFGCGFKSELI